MLVDNDRLLEQSLIFKEDSSNFCPAGLLMIPNDRLVIEFKKKSIGCCNKLGEIKCLIC